MEFISNLIKRPMSLVLNDSATVEQQQPQQSTISVMPKTPTSPPSALVTTENINNLNVTAEAQPTNNNNNKSIALNHKRRLNCIKNNNFKESTSTNSMSTVDANATAVAEMSTSDDFKPAYQQQQQHYLLNSKYSNGHNNSNGTSNNSATAIEKLLVQINDNLNEAEIAQSIGVDGANDLLNAASTAHSPFARKSPSTIKVPPSPRSQVQTTTTSPIYVVQSPSTPTAAGSASVDEFISKGVSNERAIDESSASEQPLQLNRKSEEQFKLKFEDNLIPTLTASSIALFTHAESKKDGHPKAPLQSSIKNETDTALSSDNETFAECQTYTDVINETTSAELLDTTVEDPGSDYMSEAETFRSAVNFNNSMVENIDDQLNATMENVPDLPNENTCLSTDNLVSCGDELFSTQNVPMHEPAANSALDENESMMDVDMDISSSENEAQPLEEKIPAGTFEDDKTLSNSSEHKSLTITIDNEKDLSYNGIKTEDIKNKESLNIETKADAENLGFLTTIKSDENETPSLHCKIENNPRACSPRIDLTSTATTSGEAHSPKSSPTNKNEKLNLSLDVHPPCTVTEKKSPQFPLKPKPDSKQFPRTPDSVKPVIFLEKSEYSEKLAASSKEKSGTLNVNSLSTLHLNETINLTDPSSPGIEVHLMQCNDNLSPNLNSSSDQLAASPEEKSSTLNVNTRSTLHLNEAIDLTDPKSPGIEVQVMQCNDNLSPNLNFTSDLLKSPKNELDCTFDANAEGINNLTSKSFPKPSLNKLDCTFDASALPLPMKSINPTNTNVINLNENSKKKSRDTFTITEISGTEELTSLSSSEKVNANDANSPKNRQLHVISNNTDNISPSNLPSPNANSLNCTFGASPQFNEATQIKGLVSPLSQVESIDNLTPASILKSTNQLDCTFNTNAETEINAPNKNADVKTQKRDTFNVSADGSIKAVDLNLNATINIGNDINSPANQEHKTGNDNFTSPSAMTNSNTNPLNCTFATSEVPISTQFNETTRIEHANNLDDQGHIIGTPVISTNSSSNKLDCTFNTTHALPFSMKNVNSIELNASNVNNNKEKRYTFNVIETKEKFNESIEAMDVDMDADLADEVQAANTLPHSLSPAQNQEKELFSPDCAEQFMSPAFAAEMLSSKEKSTSNSKDEKDVFENFSSPGLEDMFKPSSKQKNCAEIFLNPSDFDFLETKGNNNAQFDDDCKRNSVLLKFDPLLGRPVHPYQPEQQKLQKIFTKSISHVNSAIEEHEEEANENHSANDSVTTNHKVIDKKQLNKSAESAKKEPEGKVLQAQPCLQNNARMSVDVINDIKIQTIENSNSQLDEKQNKFNMDELEKKIKNEVLKTEDIEKKLKDAEQREEALIKRITEKDKENAKMCSVIEAYEKAIAELISEKEQLIQNYEKQLAEVKIDRDSNYYHLTSLETTFSDLHVKYEKSKEMTTQLKASEEALLAEKKLSLENLRLQEQRYEKMKNHALQQLDIANRKLETLSKEHSIESTKLKALLKKEEISRASITEQLQQKTRENAELVKICDELINGQGS